MTYTEVQQKITNLLTHPDTAQLEAVSLLDNLKGDYETLDALTVENGTYKERIRTLQDTNQRLFIMQTNGQADEKDDDTPPLTGRAAMDDFVSTLLDDGK